MAHTVLAYFDEHYGYLSASFEYLFYEAMPFIIFKFFQYSDPVYCCAERVKKECRPICYCAIMSYCKI